MPLTVYMYEFRLIIMLTLLEVPASPALEESDFNCLVASGVDQKFHVS